MARKFVTAIRAELVAPLDWGRADPPPIPLNLHGRYSRAEVFAAFGLLNEARPFPGREGVFFDEATQCDVYFITLKKSERLFSPTTRYNDYAKRGGVKLPFLCLGFTDYVSHEGERPMAIRWRLKRAIPGALYPGLAVAV
jgi:hypothetical protein